MLNINKTVFYTVIITSLLSASSWAVTPNPITLKPPVAHLSASTQAYQSANDTMHANMNITFTGDADADFLAGMIPHHQGAIDMAKVVIAHGKDPKIKALAQAIIKAQVREISEMNQLRASNSTVIVVPPMKKSATGHNHSSHVH
ncbi:MAG: hypothetical protein RL344_679 [Pseudomonadota bacterium]|jgi:hypothetical protein